VSVHGTFWGFAVIGMSYQNCWFEGRDSKERVVLGSRGRRAGFRCKACDFVGMFGAESPM
jgi:hypothetical protein